MTAAARPLIVTGAMNGGLQVLPSRTIDTVGGVPAGSYAMARPSDPSQAAKERPSTAPAAARASSQAESSAPAVAAA